ncbi:MAG: ABC transporter ATP-binding protein [Spirochaetia bacterium]|nr:ABC transporter ATP-binding protein [Spirochaetia bacterium]
MSELLRIDDIAVKYGNIQALHGVSMKVDEGAVVSLIGANGAGKSTLLKAIVGLEPLVSGSIQFQDSLIAVAARDTTQHFRFRKNHDILTTDKIAEQGIALVPEGRRVFADMTVEENLDMGAFMVRDDKLTARKKEEMYEFFPILKSRRKQKTRSLSGGEQQMMAIARALMSSPRLLLLDEPGLGLAPLIIQDIFQKIALINQEDNVTVFLVEQNAKIALRASTHGYVMENGRIVLSGPSEMLLEDPKVRAAYLGE